MFAKCPLSAGLYAIVTSLFIWLLNSTEFLTVVTVVTSSSLEVCGTTAARRRSLLLSVCKMHVLECLGKAHIIDADTSCKWPQRNTTGCKNCHMWETCDGRDIKD